MRITFHPDADEEIAEAARYYESKSPGLGFSFLVAVQAAIEQIVAHPLGCEVVGDDIRRKLLRRFPYSLLYAVETDRIRIIAVAHQKRRPNYWRSRL
jgi:plasmid stabilization system protein ParE